MNLPPPTLKSQSPCDSGWSQAPVASKGSWMADIIRVRDRLIGLRVPTKETCFPDFIIGCITAFIMSSIKNPLAAILDSNKFTGLNYQDWLQNLNIVLASEKLLYTLEKSSPKEAPADLRLVLCEELLRLDEQSRAMVNAGQRSCACDWLCWYVATGTRRGKRCALFCVLHLDDQQLVLRIEHPMRRRLDKLERRRFEDQSMLRLVLCEELLRLDEQSRAMVNAGQRSCACDWLCWYVATGTRRGKRCALFCVLRLDDQQLVLRIEHPMRRRLDKLVRRRFEDQSMLREIVRYCSLQLVVITVVSDWICLAWLEISSAVGSCVCWFGKLLVSTGFVEHCSAVSFPANSQRFRWLFCSCEVALDSSREALSSDTIFGSCRGLERKHEVAVRVRAFEVAGRAAIPHSHLTAGIIATMRRVVNYNSSWARQQQVELFDASGNPGSTAGRGFNPGGGAPGGG
ncbi:hypothetical protein F511_23940 [Dorcoceras hygrometricum]|uniref:Uncharacterized protein n=1 Tax=Dorcoceras hygrometricum TaxID=472368 RepID=A0A2Z7BG81_9LAMI|nr:hypothetical protein F511_23940 [Dorcoceras hygrometricum]